MLGVDLGQMMLPFNYLLFNDKINHKMTLLQYISYSTVTATDLDSVTNSQLTYSVSDDNFTVESLNNIGYIKTARYVHYL